MNYYTIKNGIYTEHNENIIRQQQNSMRYYQRIDYIFQIKKPNNFAEKMIEFKYQMLNPNTEQSNYNCMNLIRFFFEEDIKHLIEFKNLIICAKDFIISLKEFELFGWMQQQNPEEFEDYKKSIKKLLNEMRFDEQNNIFNQLSYLTSLYIKNNFIKL